MKKSLMVILTVFLYMLIVTGCTSNQSQNNTQSISSTAEIPEGAVSHFLSELQHENFAGAKAYYVENMDNMANLRNQLEAISPSVANKIFSKLADFTYTIESTIIDSNTPSQSTVYVTMDYYDVGQTIETILLDYIGNDISMTYDGSKDDDITKKVDEASSEALNSTTKTTESHIPISLVLEDDKWKVTKLSENPELLNALSGNIINTFNAHSNTQ